MSDHSPSTRQVSRKASSQKYCEEHKIPFSAELPELYSEDHRSLRSSEAIINRCLALCFLGLKSEGLEARQLDRFAEKYQVMDHLSPEELKFVRAKKPRNQDIVNANWRYEGMHIMLWVLGFVENLAYPDKICPVNEDLKILAIRNKEALNQDAQLRPLAEILDAADLYYRINWACEEARDQGQRPPAKLNPSVVYERHYALNWLLGDQDWDLVMAETEE